MNLSRDKVKEFASRKLYGQGINASPLPIVSAALSAINVHKKLGISYEGFIFDCRGEYVVMNYIEDDLSKIGKVMWGKVNKDSNYLKKFRKSYIKEQTISLDLYKKIDKINLKKVSKSELLDLLLKTTEAMQKSVGSGHVIEGIAYVGDRIFKDELDIFLKDNKKSNQAFALLTTPVEKSFLSKAEDLLKEVAKNPKDKKLINKFQKEFGWIRNSYDGRRPFTTGEIVREAKLLKDKKIKTSLELKKEKIKLIKKLNLPKKLVSNLNNLAFMGSWQDERKKFILIACEYLFLVLEEYANKIKVPLKYIRFALPRELRNVDKIVMTLKNRYEKSMYITTLDQVYIATDKEYDSLHALTRRSHDSDVKVINGMVASSGKIIGRAKICSTIKSLKKVEKGDILVASMTRPEYIGAMQKAAGFITDEGGITCHAAIISREMTKPCVIGTKNATRIIKDGDLVQVDAIHGVVRILETNRR